MMAGMGKNNRARRAAKQRKRQRTEHGTPRESWSWLPPDAVSVAATAIRRAADRHRRGIPAGECVRPLLDMPDVSVDRAVDEVVEDVMRGAFAGGWTPVDLSEIGRRRLDAAGSSYLMDAAAKVSAGFPDRLVDARWREQLRQLDADVWWDARRPHLTQWSGRAAMARTEALAIVVGVLALFGQLPRLDPILSPPGTPPPTGAARVVDPAQERMLVKVRALLAKAESTDSEDEAEALSAKAQELMSRYAIDQALLAHEHGVGPQVRVRRIWIDDPYVSAKSLLIDAVATANRCRSVLHGRMGFATVVGDDVDLRIVELLSTSLLLQGTRAMLAAGAQRGGSGLSRTRSYRQSFLVAYASRIGERLQAADAASTADADAGRLLPVLSARSQAVDKAFEARFPQLVSKPVSISNLAGWGAGRAAGDLAMFDVHEALAGQSSAPQSRAAS